MIYYIKKCWHSHQQFSLFWCIALYVNRYYVIFFKLKYINAHEQMSECTYAQTVRKVYMTERFPLATYFRLFTVTQAHTCTMFELNKASPDFPFGSHVFKMCSHLWSLHFEKKISFGMTHPYNKITREIKILTSEYCHLWYCGHWIIPLPVITLKHFSADPRAVSSS